MKAMNGMPARTVERGSGFVALLLALLVVAALYVGFPKFEGVVGETSAGLSAVEAGGAGACQANRRTIERAIVVWAINHPDERPTLAGLASDGLTIPSCPDGGRYELLDRRAQCTVHR